MTTLRLYLTEAWPAEPVCDWAVMGPDGRPAAEGRSDPRHWPAADRTEAVLAGHQTVWLRARLPKAPRREQDRLLRFALEEQLVQDPESQHFTPTARGAEHADVLVVARERLRQIESQLAALGRAPARVLSELDTSGQPGADWRLDLAGPHAVLHAPDALPCALDASAAAPPPLLPPLVAQARIASRLPGRIVVRLAPGLAEPEWETWADTLGLPVERGAPYIWAVFEGGTSLLHGDFRPRGGDRAWLRKARPALILMAAVLLTHAVLAVGTVVWQRAQLSDTRARMTAVFRSAFPNQPIVDPAAQLRSQLNQARQTRGLLADNDLLPILAAVGEALGGNDRDALDGIKYESGRLEVKLAARLNEQAPALAQRLRARGFEVGEPAAGLLAIRREGAR